MLTTFSSIHTEELQNQPGQPQGTQRVNRGLRIIDRRDSLREEQYVRGCIQSNRLLLTRILGTRARARAAQRVLEEQHINQLASSHQFIRQPIDDRVRAVRWLVHDDTTHQTPWHREDVRRC